MNLKLHLLKQNMTMGLRLCVASLCIVQHWCYVNCVGIKVAPLLLSAAFPRQQTYKQRLLTNPPRAPRLFASTFVVVCFLPATIEHDCIRHRPHQNGQLCVFFYIKTNVHRFVECLTHCFGFGLKRAACSPSCVRRHMASMLHLHFKKWQLHPNRMAESWWTN